MHLLPVTLRRAAGTMASDTGLPPHARPSRPPTASLASLCPAERLARVVAALSAAISTAPTGRYYRPMHWLASPTGRNGLF
jgi:hypothetical protein